MYENNKNGFDWSYLIIGILLILVSLYSFRTPITNLAAIVIVFASSAVFKGIIQLIAYSKIKKHTYYKSGILMILGILDIFIGIFLLFNLNASIVALPVVFSLWFLIQSVGELLMAGRLKNVSTSYFWFIVVASVINIILSLFLLSKPIIAALTLSFMVGTYFLVAGITYIVRAF